jgi:murein DD-endopeptidase MepM/ murein hydrolase activator NlpD
MRRTRLVALTLLCSSLALLGVALLRVAVPGSTSVVPDAPVPLADGDAPSLAQAAAPAEAEAPAQPVWTAHEISRGEALGTILPNYGMPTGAVRTAALPHHDLAKIRAGQVLRFLTPSGAETPTELHYKLGMDETLVVFQDGEGWAARVDAVTYERKVATREFEVTTSLWQAAVDAGLHPRDIVGLAGVYRFDIDFNTEIRAGARVRMVVEELWDDEGFARLGAPIAVVMTNGGKDYTAIRYQDGDKDPQYYDTQGRARKKPFLRSPLKFSRVTSGFNRNRYHPVLKRRRPHNGVDFGAPKGTPVHAIGDGKVTFSGTNGGHGRFVKLDHAGPYASSYSHLSKLTVKKGQRVRQGQIIGYVGSTGLATGPHLHYQFWVNGKYVNPLTVKLPSAGVPAVQDKAGFAAWRDRWLAELGPEADTGAAAVADAGTEG